MRTTLSLALALLLCAPAVADDERDARALFVDALEHDDAGREAEARALYVEIVEIDPDHRAARRALGYVEVGGAWVEQASALEPLGLVRVDGRVTLAEAPADVGIDPVSRPSARRAALVMALDDNAAQVRRDAACALAGDLSPEVREALVGAALDDREASVRAVAVASLAGHPDDATTDQFLHALSSRRVATRARAADALATLGDERALAHLVYRWEKSSGDFPRAYFAQAAQLSYIQDFDVEVASTSFIADPIVGVLQSGVVQNVKVNSTRVVVTTVERVALHGALVEIAGENVGATPRAWRRWLTARRSARSLRGGGAVGHSGAIVKTMPSSKLVK